MNEHSFCSCKIKGEHKSNLVGSDLPDHFRAEQKLKHVIKGLVPMFLKH